MKSKQWLLNTIFIAVLIFLVYTTFVLHDSVNTLEEAHTNLQEDVQEKFRGFEPTCTKHSPEYIIIANNTKCGSATSRDNSTICFSKQNCDSEFSDRRCETQEGCLSMCFEKHGYNNITVKNQAGCEEEVLLRKP